nr:TPA_asm: hypothetical protein HUJ06_013851 [Nelumbo nucifera]
MSSNSVQFRSLVSSTTHISVNIHLLSTNTKKTPEFVPKNEGVGGKLDGSDCQVSLWIRFALDRKVKVLDLEFLEKPIYKLPYRIFITDSLMELRLTGCIVEELPGPICLRSLKSLYLENIELTEEKMTCILLGCPLLDDLFLIWCSNRSKMNVISSSVKKVDYAFVMICWG